jgi:methyl coenzyme M reductase subunit C-like uncharacterized protein (methanogenesis marker protein 7)
MSKINEHINSVNLVLKEIEMIEQDLLINKNKLSKEEYIKKIAKLKILEKKLSEISDN